jgi:hypothetical protein
MTEQEKTDYINRIFPGLSERGQNYLQRIAEAMLFIQEPAFSPVHDSDKEIAEEDHNEK